MLLACGMFVHLIRQASLDTEVPVQITAILHSSPTLSLNARLGNDREGLRKHHAYQQYIRPKDSENEHLNIF